MDSHSKLPPISIKAMVSKFLLVFVFLVALLLSTFSSSPSLPQWRPSSQQLQHHQRLQVQNPASAMHLPLRKNRFLQVPQIVWGLNNQKIALARAALTARFLNRTLLMPQLSAALFYKETDLLQPMPFDRLFSLERFNALCDGFVAIAPVSVVPGNADVMNVTKGSGRRWTLERDAAQLNDCRNSEIDEHTVLQFLGKHPFLWHDHWPVKDYAKVFECLVLADDISAEVDKVVDKLLQYGRSLSGNNILESGKGKASTELASSAYIAVHMRIEKDWMIHCKKLENRALVRHNKNLRICSSKQEIAAGVSRLPNILKPSIVYLAVADDLLENSSILDGWGPGLVPVEKKRLNVMELYHKHPYIIQSAIDYEVCLRSDVFVGNSFSTFSSLIVLERTMKLVRRGSLNVCGKDLPSYAYNIPRKDGSPQPWIANLSDSSLKSISYGTNEVACFFR